MHGLPIPPPAFAKRPRPALALRACWLAARPTTSCASRVNSAPATTGAGEPCALSLLCNQERSDVFLDYSNRCISWLLATYGTGVASVLCKTGKLALYPASSQGQQRLQLTHLLVSLLLQLAGLCSASLCSARPIKYFPYFSNSHICLKWECLLAIPAAQRAPDSRTAVQAAIMHA